MRRSGESGSFGEDMPAAVAPPARREPYLVGAASALLWWLTRSRIHGWDAVAYAARAVDDPLLSERYLSTRLLHPHHLLYLPLARTAVALARALGLQPHAGAPAAAVDPFVVLQFLSAVGAGMAVALTGLTLLENGVPRGAARVAMLGVAGSSALWRYGGDVEAMTPALALLLVGVLVGSRARTTADWLRAGLWCAGAVLVHELAAVVAAAMGAVVAVEAARARIRASAAAVFAAAVAVPTGLAYACATIVENVAIAPGGVPGWLFAAAGREMLTRTGPWTAMRQSLQGAATAIVPEEPLVAVRWLVPRDPVPWVGAALSGLALAAVGSLMWVAAPRVVHAWRAGERLTRVALASSFALVLAVGAYQPANPDYWVFLPPMLALLLTPALAAGLGVRWSRLALALPPLLLILSATFVCAPRRDPARAADAPFLGWVAAHLRQGDLVWIDAVGRGEGPDLELVSVPLRTGVDVRIAPAAADGSGLDNARRVTHELAARGRTVAAVSVVMERLALARIRPVLGDTLGRVGAITFLRVAADEPTEPRH